MIQFFKQLFIKYGISEGISNYLSNGIAIIIIVSLCLIVNVVTKKILLKTLNIYIAKSKSKWDDVLLKKKVFERLTQILPILIIHESASLFPVWETWIQRIAFSYITILILMVLNNIVDSIDDIYSQYIISKARPIKGYLQVLKIFFAIASGIVIISSLINRSPWILLSGLGAATAVIMLIFQSSILGLVASIQLASNNMVQIGDWIEMPSHGADGDVIEISLHTVKVQNFDNTIVTIPPHALINESFKNWKGMQESGGRRIKRCIYIDMTSIKFCDDDMLERLKNIQSIKEYIETKTAEIDQYNKENNRSSSSLVNGRRMTNIGTFRAYVERYIKYHQKLNPNMTMIVRQLQSGEYGLPIEIYSFTNTINWVEYEGIQSDIFEHVLAILPEFELKIYQNPTGSDISKLASNR